MAFNWRAAGQAFSGSLAASWDDQQKRQREWQRDQKMMEVQMMRQREQTMWQRGMQKQWDEDDYQTGLLRGAQERETMQGEVAEKAEALYGPGDSWEKRQYIASGGKQGEMPFDQQLQQKKKLSEAEIQTQIEQMPAMTRAKLEAEAQANGKTLQEYVALKGAALDRAAMTPEEQAIEAARAIGAKADEMMKIYRPDMEPGSEEYMAEHSRLSNVATKNTQMSHEQRRLWHKDATDYAFKKVPEDTTDDEALNAGFGTVDEWRQDEVLKYLENAEVPNTGPGGAQITEGDIKIIAQQPKDVQDRFIKTVEKQKGPKAAKKSKDAIAAIGSEKEAAALAELEDAPSYDMPKPKGKKEPGTWEEFKAAGPAIKKFFKWLDTTVPEGY